MKSLYQTALILTLLFVFLSPGFGAKKALLVGINEYPGNIANLVACHNDVALVRKFLCESLGFQESDILELKDVEATADGITRAIKEHLIEGTEPGDTVVFYYAGHGTGVKDLDEDEKDGLDETLMPYDFDDTNPRTWFTDDLLFELFQRIPTHKVVVIHDCCHSGTGNRGGGSPPKTSSTEGRVRFSDHGYRTFEMDHDDAFRKSRSVLSVRQHPDHLFLAACQDSQLSWESVFDGEPHGFFTHTLLKALREHPDVPLGEVTATIKREMIEVSSTTPGQPLQEPSFELGSQGGLSLSAYLSEAFEESPISDAVGEGVPNRRPLTLDDVAPGYVPTGNIGVEMAIRKPGQSPEQSGNTFRAGELIEISLLVDTDSYVEIYYYGVDDQVHRIFPNSRHSENFIRAGRRLDIPGEMGFLLRLGLPGDWDTPIANEVLYAVVSDEPFSESDSSENSNNMFRVVDGRKLNPAHQRIIRIESRRAHGEAMKIYRIQK